MATSNTEQNPDKSYRFETLVVHVGSEPDQQTGAVCVPISLASTFSQSSPGILPGRNDPNSFGKGFEYSRTGNPTRGAFERCIAASESGAYAIAFSSGSAATSAIIHLLNSGDHVVCVDDVYGGTQRYFRRIALPSSNIQFTFVDFNDTEKFEAAFTPATKMIWLETPTNPTLKISDIARTAEYAKQRGCIFCVDNTFMSPYFQNPLTLGADIVVHSVTKYIGGHSDVVMGVAATNSNDIYERLRFVQNGVGSVPGPFDCYLALRGMKTLHLRMAAASRNAQIIAEFLEAHPKVERVIYPGLLSHPQHELAKQQQKGFGAMITFYVKGNAEHAKKFIESVRLLTLAESLGAVESLVESPALMTHASVPPEKRAELGISDTLIRLSIGIENVDDLINDIRFALDEMGEVV